MKFYFRVFGSGAFVAGGVRSMVMRTAIFATFCLLVLSRGPADALDKSKEKHAVAAPTWVATPTPEQVSDAYPKGAASVGMEGNVILRCTLKVDQTLQTCRVERETPPGLGFGSAALSITPHFHLSPKTIDGHPVDSEIHIPVVFNAEVNDGYGDSAPSLADAMAKDPKAVVEARFIAGRLSRLDATISGVQVLYARWMKGLFMDDTGIVPEDIARSMALATEDLAESRSDRFTAALAMTYSGEQLKAISDFLKTPAGEVFAARLWSAIGISSLNDKELVASFARSWRQRACATNSCSSKQIAAFDMIDRYVADMPRLNAVK